MITWVCNISLKKGKFHSVYFVTFYRIINELCVKNLVSMALDLMRHGAVVKLINCFNHICKNGLSSSALCAHG